MHVSTGVNPCEAVEMAMAAFGLTNHGGGRSCTGEPGVPAEAELGRLIAEALYRLVKTLKAG